MIMTFSFIKTLNLNYFFFICFFFFVISSTEAVSNIMANKAEIKQEDQYLVYGYCKRMQRKLLQNQIMPESIMYLCLLFYIALERFEDHAESIEIINNNIAKWICNGCGTIYGIYNIINEPGVCFSWTFKLINYTKSHKKYPYIIGLGIDNEYPKQLDDVWWQKEINNSNLYAITTTGLAISNEYLSKRDESFRKDHYFHESFKYNDEIKMELNTKKKYLIFYKNDQEFTYFREVIFDDTKPYHMFISAEDANATIELVDFQIIKLNNSF